MVGTYGGYMGSDNTVPKGYLMRIFDGVRKQY